MASGISLEQPNFGTKPRRIRRVAALIASVLVLALATAAPAAAGCDDDERPAAPHSLRANPLSSGGIMLQWSSNAGHYDIYIRDAKGRPVKEAPDIVGGATNRNYLEFYGLKPDTQYFFSIRARSEGGTQGCVSKNASETVSARTDTADLQQTCHYYTQNAMEGIAELQRRGCKLPDDSMFGRWATNEGNVFSYCMTQKRAKSMEPEHFEWLRNQDRYACKVRAEKCAAYRDSALREGRISRDNKCGFTGPRWSPNLGDHYNWCMNPATTQFRKTVEARARHRENRICLEKKKAAQSGGGGGTGGGGSCAVPGDWSDMLAAHNEMRGQYCASPLSWDCGLAAEAQKFAEECACGHSNAPGVGENLAARGVDPDKFPASSDRVAFDETWGCEKDLYDFNNPKIVGGFKNNCKGPPEGVGVNGHFTQVVWKGNKQLGCGRARCPNTDDKCKIIPGFHTNWVCRYRGFDANGNSVGGNDTGKLAANVQKPPNCTTQNFHSRSSTKCFRGMVETRSGQCACPTGTRWNGRVCAIPPRSSNPASSRPPPPPVTTSPRCPADRPNGTFPDCCPQSSRFENGVCKQSSGGSNSSSGGGGTTSRRQVCRSPRPVGTFPDCCPTGTVFSGGVCRRPTGGGGSNGTTTTRDVCKPPRPVGTFPNCCPEGMSFTNGACRKPTGGGGSNGTNPNTGYPGCPRSRPNGTPPNCCPEGTNFTNGACRRPTGGGGTNGTNPNTGDPGCPRSRPNGTPPNCCPEGTNYTTGACRRPAASGGGGTTTSKPCPQGMTGTPPNCCPPGTLYQSGKCVRPATTTPPPTTTPTPTTPAKCTGGRIGRPPYCRCPTGTRYLGGRCRRIASPTVPGPAPKKVCPSGLTGPNCDQIIVR